MKPPYLMTYGLCINVIFNIGQPRNSLNFVRSNFIQQFRADHPEQ